MTRIIIESIVPDKMRYDTLGDWFWNDDGDMVIQVAGTDPLQSADDFLVALHELIEVKLCLNHGITQNNVDQFDLNFTGDGEPGDDPMAPYRAEHRCAMLIEHMAAHFLGLSDYGVVE